MQRINITFYTKEYCPLCDEGLAVLHDIQQEYPITITVVDIYKDDALLEKYQVMIPVVAIGEDEIDYGILSEEKIRNRLLSDFL